MILILLLGLSISLVSTKEIMIVTSKGQVNQFDWMQRHFDSLPWPDKFEFKQDYQIKMKMYMVT